MIRNLTGGLLLATLFAASAVASPLKLGRPYRDESNGFKIQPPDKWDQVPTKFKEVTVIGKWVGKPKRGYYQPAGYVLRFLKTTARPEEERGTPPEGGLRGIPGYRGLLQGQPKDVWEFIKGRYWAKFAIVDEDAEFKVKRGLKGHYRVYHQEMRGALPGREREQAKGQLMLVAAQIETEAESDSSYGILFECTVADSKDMLRTFQAAIKRFRILETDEEDTEDGVADADIFVDSETKPEAWRAVRKKKLIPGWAALDTKNYLVIYNKKVKKSLLKTIARHIEAIRSQVYEQVFPPQREVKAISVVRVCKDRAEYHKYGGPGGSAGYWSPGDEELVFYQDKNNKKDSLRVLYHEAFHQYIHYAVGKVAPHSWFNEGHGDYFAGHNYKGKKFQADVFRWRTGIISNAIARKSYVPLKDFLKYTQGQYYSNPGLCYAQGWSFVYFLREVERKKIKKYKQYWGLLDAYFDQIKKNVQKVKDEGLYGLEETPIPGSGDEESGGDLPDGSPEGAEPDAPPGLPKVPGIDTPFPGEHPEAGAKPEEDKLDTTSESTSVVGNRITGIRSGLDAAVDKVFFQNRRIDLDQLEKDWVSFIKRNG